MENRGLTRVRYVGDKVIIVSGPVPEHALKDAIEVTELNPVPGKTHAIEKPKPPKFVAPPKAAAAPKPAAPAAKTTVAKEKK